MTTEEMPSVTGKAPQTTTARRELFGWWGSMSWTILMMWGYDIFIKNDTLFTQGTVIGTAFMLLLALSITIFSYRFGRNPNELAAIAHLTTPAAILLSVAFVYFPKPVDMVLYLLSAVLMAPGFTRRAYGIIITGTPGKKITRYLSGWAIAFVVFASWVAAHPPVKTAFFVPALLAFPLWFGIRHNIPVPEETSITKKTMFSKSSLFLFLGTFAVLFWLALMWEMLIGFLFAGGDISSNTPSVVDTFMTWIPVSIGIMVFAIVSDKGYDRLGFIISMGLFLISIIVVLVTGYGKNEVLLPLAMALLFGGMYTQYFSCTFPIYFFETYNRPVFIAASGCIVSITRQGIGWQKSLFLPKIILELGTPLYITAAITAVIFIMIVFFLFERHRERTLAAALFALLHGKVDEETAASDKKEKLTKIEELFTPEERDIALLLIEGKMRSEITRSLHLTADEANKRMGAIRTKINQMGDSDPLIAAAIAEYKLTPRETDMLRCFRRGMTNVEIAAELFLSEETIKTHVRTLLNKLNINTRKDLPSWEETFRKRKT